MSVDTSQIVGEISWSQSKTNSPFAAIKQGPDKLTQVISPSITTFNRIYAVSGTLAAGASVTIDLRNITDYLSQALTLTTIRALMIKAVGVDMIYSPAASNGLTWFLLGTTPAIVVKAGGFFLIGDGEGFPVTSTDKSFTITNDDGSLTGTYEVALIGGQ